MAPPFFCCCPLVYYIIKGSLTYCSSDSQSQILRNHMENGRQPKLTIALTNTTDVLIPVNGQSEENNTNGDRAEYGMETGSDRQDSMNGLSSRFLLASSHAPSITVDFELLWRLRKYLVMLAILAVSVTYNAGLTPPGGFRTKNTTNGRDAGEPLLRVYFFPRYEVFFYCNATAFAASLVLIILLLSKSVTRQNLWLRSMQFTMILDLFSLMGAYAAGSCRAVKSSIYIWVLVVAVFIYVGIHILLCTRIFPKWLKERVQMLLQKIQAKWGVHEENRSNDQKRNIEEARKFILTLATFSATITYQAGLSPPGGFWTEGSSHPATPILRSNYLLRYNFFMSCNATSFVASLVTIMLLLSPELSMHGIRSKAVIVCVVADLLGLIGAYAAGSCRDIAVSFYVMSVSIIVLTCFVVLAGILVYKPVADWLQKIKPDTLTCIGTIGRVFSLDFKRNRSIDREQENSQANHLQTELEPDAQVKENALQSTDIEEGESHAKNQPSGECQSANSEEAEPDSDHPSAGYQQSMCSTDVVYNLQGQSIDDQAQPTAEESISNTQHPSEKSQHATNYKDGMHQSADNQQDANTKENSSSIDDFKTLKDGISDPEPQSADSHQVTDMKEQSTMTNDLKTTDTEGSMPDPDNRSTDSQHVINKMEQSSSTDEPGTVVTPEEKVSPNVPVGHSEIEIAEDNKIAPHVENGYIDKNERSPNEDGNRNQTAKHLKKCRTYLLLLAILAVSLTYQSGLNPPGGFWTRHEDYHSSGDHILEDTHHPRYIAFFYLNAIAFVASVVMIIMLLNRRMANKVIKRRALQIAMIVILLSLTGAYVMGSCRKTKNSVYISVMVLLVLAYVGIHVLIAIHVIPEGWKRQVAEKLNRLSCRHLWSPLHGSNQTGHGNEKDWERRRNLLLILSILAATVTYQAGMNPPGSVWSDDKDINRTLTGNPVLQENNLRRYNVFYYSNSVSFVSSVVITILLVNKGSCEHGMKFYALRVCLAAGLVGLLIAYAAGSCRKAKQSIYLIIVAVAVLISLMIQVFIMSSTYDKLGKPLCKCMESLLEWIFQTKEVRQDIGSEIQGSPDPGDKSERKRHKYLMLLSILAASITYQAGLNPPGGFWSDDSSDPPKHKAGDPVLHNIHPHRYKAFFCFNAFSFMSSIVVIMLLLSKSVREKNVPLGVLHLIMILDLLALMTAFAAGSCRKFRTSVYVYGLVIGVTIYLLLVTILASSIAKCLRSRKISKNSYEKHHEHPSRSL
uniref:PGG domain-containing protein n=1 Tax=Oryza nivara TaxID=4536 RepID=A0A0E0HP67_ORYNI